MVKRLLLALFAVFVLSVGLVRADDVICLIDGPTFSLYDLASTDIVYQTGYAADWGLDYDPVIQTVTYTSTSGAKFTSFYLDPQPIDPTLLPIAPGPGVPPPDYLDKYRLTGTDTEWYYWKFLEPFDPTLWPIGPWKN